MSARTLMAAAVKTALGLGLALSAPRAWSADWQFNPRVELGGQADSNYRLNLPGFEDSVSGGFADVQLQLRSAGQINNFTLTPAVHATKFSSSSGDSSTDPSLDLDFAHHGLTSTLGFTGTVSKASVARTDRATTDIGGSGLGNPTGGDSGYLTIRDRRQLTMVAPSASFDLTQRSRLLLNADYAKVDYDREIPGVYVGSSNLDGAIGVAHEWSQRTTLTLRGRYSRYDPNGAFSTVDSYGVEGEWRRHVTQLAESYIRIGGLRSSFSRLGAAPAPDSVTSVVAGAGINWTFQITQLFLDATRTIDPNATGFSVVRDQLRLRITKNLTPRFSVAIGARGYRDTATGKITTYRERKYLVGSLGLTWRFRRAWTLAAAYDQSWQRYQLDPSAADSRAGTVSLVYEPNQRE